MDISSQAGIASFEGLAIPPIVRITPLVIPSVLAEDAVTTVPKAA